MRAALPEDDPADGRLADDARLSVTMVDTVQGREVAGLAAWVAEVRDGAATMTNPGFQDGAYAPSQGPDLLPVKRRRPPRGPDARAEKGFIRVDVPDTGNPSLIQEQRLDSRSRAPAHLREGRRIEHGVQRLHPDAERGIHGMRRQYENLSELSDIPVREDPTTGETEVGMRMTVRSKAILRIPPEELSGHPQTHDEAVLAKIEKKELPPPTESSDASSDDDCRDLLRRAAAPRQTRLDDPSLEDRASHDPRDQGSPYHLHFRQLRHLVVSRARRLLGSPTRRYVAQGVRQESGLEKSSGREARIRVSAATHWLVDGKASAKARTDTAASA